MLQPIGEIDTISGKKLQHVLLRLTGSEKKLQHSGKILTDSEKKECTPGFILRRGLRSEVFVVQFNSSSIFLPKKRPVLRRRTDLFTPGKPKPPVEIKE